MNTSRDNQQQVVTDIKETAAVGHVDTSTNEDLKCFQTIQSV